MSTATACPCVAWVSSAADSKRIVLPKPSFREDVGTIEVACAVQTANDWNKQLCFTASWTSSVLLCRSVSGTLPALSHLAGMPLHCRVQHAPLCISVAMQILCWWLYWLLSVLSCSLMWGQQGKDWPYVKVGSLLQWLGQVWPCIAKLLKAFH